MKFKDICLVTVTFLATHLFITPYILTATNQSAYQGKAIQKCGIWCGEKTRNFVRGFFPSNSDPELTTIPGNSPFSD